MSWFNPRMAVNHIERWTALKAFIAQCGGQKAASIKLKVSPQFVGQLVHRQRSVPDALFAKISKHRALVEK